LRQLVYDGNFAPFTPSFGAEWKVWKNKIHQLKLTSNLARSFKVPTLNDRYWVPGGNPDLQSEKSLSGEAGLQHILQNEKFNLTQSVTFFKMKVDNWIIWLPQGNIWRPENIRKVNNSGLEYNLEGKKKVGTWDLGLDVNYSWIRAINQTDISENDRSKGNQLPHTPEHKLQSTLSFERNSFRGFLNSQYVGERYSGTDGSGRLDPYRLWDMGGNHQIYFWKLKGSIGFQINNILNTTYQVMPLRAMPGRNYQINFNLTL
jgi:vitamin B12 transporter